MKYKGIIGWVILVAFNNCNYLQSNAITYELNGGRFGDCIMTFAKALSLSLKYNFPFYPKPFPYSNQLMIDVIDVTNVKHKKIKYVPLTHENQINSLARNVMFVMSYYTPLKDWNDWQHNMFPKNFNERFIRELRRYIRPRNAVPKLQIPEGMTSVALHVRKGGGFDMPLLTEQTKVTKPVDKYHYVDVDFPLKFPPDEYYIEQLKFLSEYFEDKPLYVFIFTDDKNPERLEKKYKAALNKPNIIFDFRKNGNSHNANVVEDFFAMTQCSCLIRGDSSFSRAAHLIGDFKVVIYPEHCLWQENKMIIDKVMKVIKDV